MSITGNITGISSMTGYGRAEITAVAASGYVVEIHSVNHRYLDLSIKSPREFLPIEQSLRRIAGERLHRGKVDVLISQRKGAIAAGKGFSIDTGLARQIMADLGRFQEELAIPGEIDLSTLLEFKSYFCTEESSTVAVDQIGPSVEVALHSALDSLVAMRGVEGEALTQDLLQRLGDIEAGFERIRSLAPAVVTEYRTRLAQRIGNLMQEGLPEPGRLEQEIAHFADRCDITEEIVRAESHIAQFRATISAGGVVGRKLDFLSQEIGREINTIGSKANDSGITADVIAVKSDLEKVREQVQNIE